MLKVFAREQVETSGTLVWPSGVVGPTGGKRTGGRLDRDTLSQAVHDGVREASLVSLVSFCCRLGLD